MTDVHTPEVRSRNMAAIRGKDTRPELILRKALFAAGLRYRIHVKELPGRPDIVFPRKYHAAIFVHGCFYHGHECPTFRWPKQNSKFWKNKIQANRARDRRQQKALMRDGWRVLTVWECAIRGPRMIPTAALAGLISHWLASPRRTGNFEGAS